MKKAEIYHSSIIEDLLNEIPQEEAERVHKRMLLAARIDDAINEKGWKKKDFAKAMNKVPSEISKWLSGTHNFNSDTLFDIERVLDIKLINVSELQPQKYEVTVSVRTESQKTGMQKFFNQDFLKGIYGGMLYSSELQTKNQFEYQA